MHLLVQERGSLAEDGEAVDLGQSPGDILFLSAADTELAALAGACQSIAMRSWRLASLGDLRHPMSVDTLVARHAPKTRLIIIRALGGASYFSYVIECFFAAATANGAQIAVLPGDDKPDPGLDAWSTVSAADRLLLQGLLSEGGVDNTNAFVRSAEALSTGARPEETVRPLLKAGLFSRYGEADLETLKRRWRDGAPVAAICFYRALVQSGQTAPVEALSRALEEAGLNVLPLYVSSLKDPVSAATVSSLFGSVLPDVVINATGFAVSQPGSKRAPSVLEETGATVLQVVFAGSGRDQWKASAQGLSSRDLAMHVALPEVDGRVLTRAVSFKAAAHYDEAVEANIVTHEPDHERAAFVARLAAKWARLRQSKPEERRVAIVLANYPNKDGRLANGVGLDTPEGTLEVIRSLKAAGYSIENAPEKGSDLITLLRQGVTNQQAEGRAIRDVLPLADYLRFFEAMPDSARKAIRERWGAPQDDPFFGDGVFRLPLVRFGSVWCGIQPARGYNIDPKETYHSPDLVPPHGYLAFYAYLRQAVDVHAIIHMGKHGNLEWLPGKALALSESCWPEIALGPVPHVYPFIVNDPGEGTQAKRRASAVIIDHLTPPLTRAEAHGPMKDLEGLVDEYYEAMGHDPRRLRLLKARILDLANDTGIRADAGVEDADDEDLALQKLDAFLCDLKELQIRDGLHVFGQSPDGRLMDDLLVALARLDRGAAPGERSLHRAIAADLQLGEAFDPLDCAFAEPWTGTKPDMLLAVSDDPWRTNGDTVERIELLASALVSGSLTCPDTFRRTTAVLCGIEADLRPSVRACGASEISGILSALDGRFVPPGPSGAPTRGRPDVLPTGRNFYSVDCRAVPTPAAWELGRKSAELLITRHVQDHGEWPKAVALTAWGTANMRTGGDDIAQALALIGAKPVWDTASRRVTGFEIIPQALLARPRVDVTLRVSGFFRDAFPDQIALFDKAVRAVATLEEEEADNPIAARSREEAALALASGMSEAEAQRAATFRVFGSKPGAYGAGLQALIDEGGWRDADDLAEAFLIWGGYAYGAGEEGAPARDLFEQRLSRVEAVVQNQDNREHDLLDSDDYYQFEGGMTAAVAKLSGTRPAIYHNDHSRPERPVIRSLEEEIARVVRARASNPKWIAGVMRHGYKGAFEMAATVDYLFAFSATTGAVRDHHFEALYRAYLGDDKVREFLEDNNPDALKEMAKRFLEAIERGLWTAKSNSAMFDLTELACKQ